MKKTLFLIGMICVALIGRAQVDFTEAAEKSVNAVVHIRAEIVTSNTYYDFFGAFLEQIYGGKIEIPDNVSVGFGSGVVISPDGYIVTNNHVVEGARKIEVTFNNKHKRLAKIIGTDPTTDIALIKVEAKDLECLTFGDSDQVRVGEWVLAVGNPFNLTSTVTAGIVSAKARNINILGNGTIESFIHTEAAVKSWQQWRRIGQHQGRSGRHQRGNSVAHRKLRRLFIRHSVQYRQESG